MKQIVFFVFLHFCCSSIYPQGKGVRYKFIEEDKTWEYTFSQNDKYFYWFSGDTIIDGKNYKKVSCRKNDDEGIYYGACREIGGEVFIRYDNADNDYLLYDFSFRERMISDCKEEYNTQEYESQIIINNQARRLFNVQECYYEGEIEHDGVLVSDYICPKCHSYTIEGIGHISIPFTRGSICGNSNLKVKKGNTLLFDGSSFSEYKRTNNTDNFFSPFLEDGRHWFVAEKNENDNFHIFCYKINGKDTKNGKEYFRLYRLDIAYISSAQTEENYAEHFANIREDDGKLFFDDLKNNNGELCTINLNRFKQLDLWDRNVPYSDLFPDSYVEENEMQQDNGRVFRQQVIRKDCEDGYVGREYVREGVGAMHFPFLPMIASSDKEEADMPVLLLCIGADGTVYYEADHNSELWQELIATGINSQTYKKRKGTTYDLQGRRVKQKDKGLYIKDGKKILL